MGNNRPLLPAMRGFPVRHWKMTQHDGQRTKDKRDYVTFIPVPSVRRTLAYRLTSWKRQGCATALAEVQLVALATVAGQRALQCQKLKSNYLTYSSNFQDHCGVQPLCLDRILPRQGSSFEWSLHPLAVATIIRGAAEQRFWDPLPCHLTMLALCWHGRKAE
jgi:hypothetical protein